MRTSIIAGMALCAGLVAGFFFGRGVPSDRPPGPNSSEREQADRPVVVLTPEAVKQAFRARDQHKVVGRWRLRVEVKELPGGKGKHTVDLDLDPTSPDDFEYDFEGIRIVIARTQIEKLKGTTVGYYEYPDRQGFFVKNPNLADSTEY
jgi:Fe-S cluster assembly iron-binding protein IscA